MRNSVKRRTGGMRKDEENDSPCVWTDVAGAVRLPVSGHCVRSAAAARGIRLAVGAVHQPACLFSALQFVLVGFLSGGASLLSVAVMALSLGSRHMFYGLSFLDKFREMGKKGLYMVFSLTDETYSLLCGTRSSDADEKKLYF